MNNSTAPRGRTLVQTGLRRNAAIFRTWAANTLGVQLEYNRDGVRWLGGHINEARDTVTADLYSREVSLYGSFLGECLCRIYGGRWVKRGKSWIVQCDSGTQRLDIYVFDKVKRQIENGPTDNVESYLEVLDDYLVAETPQLVRTPLP